LLRDRKAESAIDAKLEGIEFLFCRGKRRWSRGFKPFGTNDQFRDRLGSRILLGVCWLEFLTCRPELTLDAPQLAM